MAERTKTVKPSGGDYATLALALAGEACDLTSVGGILHIKIDGDWSGGNDTTAANVTGFTNPTATNYVDIYSSAACRHAGKYDATKYAIVNTTPGMLTISVAYTRITGIQVYCSGVADAMYAIALQTSGANYILIDSCIAKTNNQGAAGPSQGVLIGSGDYLTFRNCIFFHSYDGVRTYWGAGSGVGHLDFQGCDFVANVGYGIDSGNGTVTCKDCYSGGNGGAGFDYNGTITFTTCASSDATVRTGVTPSIAYDTQTGTGHAGFTNVTAGNENLAIKAGSVLLAAGTAESGLILDIDGQIRPATPSIGAWDIPAAGGGGVGGAMLARFRRT